MAVQREIFTQNLFVRGIGQSPYLPEQGAVADMEGVDVVSRYGVVSLIRGSYFTNLGNPQNVGGDEIVGKDVLGRNLGTVDEPFIFFKNWNFVPQNRANPLITVNEGTLGTLYHATHIPLWNANIYIARNDTVSDGFDMYTTTAQATNPKTAIQALSRDNLATNVKNINPGVRGYTRAVQSVFIGGTLFLALGDAIYRVYRPNVNTVAYVVEKGIEIESGFEVVRMLPHGDGVHIYAIDRKKEYSDPSPQKTYRYIWNLTGEAWSRRDEIPGTFFDAVNFNGIDMLLWDDNIGYFNGTDLVVLRKIPQVSGKIVRPLFRSGNVSGGFLTFLTMQLSPISALNPPQISSYENDASGVALWQFGRNLDGNDFSLQKKYRFFAGYHFVEGEMVGNRFGDVFFDAETSGYLNIVESAALENSVHYFLFSQKNPDPSTDSAFLAFLQPMNVRETVTNYVQSGYVTTQEIGREFREAKRLERIGVNASIPDNSQVKVSVAVDGSDSFTEVAVFGIRGIEQPSVDGGWGEGDRAIPHYAAEGGAS